MKWTYFYLYVILDIFSRYVVGRMVAGGHSGTVERLAVRTVTLRDLAGTVQVVPFGEVTTVKNYNRDYGYALIDAGVAYRERYGDVVQALQDVAVELSRDEIWGLDIIGDLEVFGLNSLGDSAVEIRVRLKTRPMRRFAVRRAFLEKMKRMFDERGIEIPFPHRTIWFGTDKDGTAPPMFLAKDSHKALEPPGPQASAESETELVSESEASHDVGEDREHASDESKAAGQHDGMVLSRIGFIRKCQSLYAQPCPLRWGGSSQALRL